jgi:hypothetical protein
MKRSAKALRQHDKTLASSASKAKRRAKARRPRIPGIRETEEAHALLEEQLGSLYWWAFNAFKMRGFIRAQGLYEAAERQLDKDRDAAMKQPSIASNDGSKRGR